MDKTENTIKLERRVFNGHYVNVHETTEIILGFTELGFPAEDLPLLFAGRCKKVIHLNQVHTDGIYFASAITAGEERDGDGIILDEKGTLGVIQTADCTPLFFWDEWGQTGGVLHIGWQGLLHGIEKKALKLLDNAKRGVPPQQLHYYLGPAIEQSCYEVGQDLVAKFAGKSYASEIFMHHPQNKEKYLMDVKKGIRASLKEAGIPDDKITDSCLCTFCEVLRFPSYRRYRDSGERIYNFLVLK